MRRVLDWLWVLVHPSYWLMNYPSSPVLSEWINARLDAGELPQRQSEHTAKLGGRVLWVENYPYAYGRIWQPGYPGNVMPDRQTIRRLHRALGDLSPEAQMRELLKGPQP